MVKFTIKEELAGKPTGFEVLMETKRKNLSRLHTLLLEEPGITRTRICYELSISKRTASRYLKEMRKRLKKGAIKTQDELQLIEKRRRLKRLKRLVTRHPEYNREALAKELNVCSRTLSDYFKELEE